MRVSVTVWHLELTDPAAFVASEREPRFELRREVSPSPALARSLYAGVGAQYHWTDRLPWSPEQWNARMADPAVELWVAYQDGLPAGYFELGAHPDGTVEIVLFGLMPQAVGGGQGGALLTSAVRQAWAMGAKRVYLNTCSLDHSRALPNYRARGFRVFREEVKNREIEDR